MNLKAIILVGGPQKGTRFRPLSLDVPKPLFPIAGFPLIHHHIEACFKISSVSEIHLIGFFQPSDAIEQFIKRERQIHGKPITYLQEYTMLGTAGSIYHFRDVITSNDPEGFFLMFSDAFCEFPLQEMIDFKKKFMPYVMMTVQVPKEQSQQFGCAGVNTQTNEVVHFVEKPDTFVSSDINAGVFLLSTEIFKDIGRLFQSRYKARSTSNISCSISNDISTPHNNQRDAAHNTQCGSMSLELEVLPDLASKRKLFSYKYNKFWLSIKSAGSALYANREILRHYKSKNCELLSESTSCIGNVYIHPSAQVHPNAVLGPDVTISSGVVVGQGARIRNAIILDGAIIQSHSCTLNSIIGWNSVVGKWSRVEGTASEIDPNARYATTDNFYLFDDQGKLRPSITILGRHVNIPEEVIIRNSIVLPHKEISRGFHNQILL